MESVAADSGTARLALTFSKSSIAGLVMVAVVLVGVRGFQGTSSRSILLTLIIKFLYLQYIRSHLFGE